MLYPLTFHPRYKERVWGGRKLELLFGKPLPPDTPIGESWEITDRPGDISQVANGPLAGTGLRALLARFPAELLGSAAHGAKQFPLLIKILDARQTLSVQVHPPPSEARRLGGEPKTEMWYIAHAEPDAVLYAGLKAGVSRELFAEKIRDGTVADCLHRVPVQAGDAMFLPSGRVHAIGGGLVIFEIQQNSDTTYRVFDWNRVGLDGKPRALHVEESLACIQFEDFEPNAIRSNYSNNPVFKTRYLVDDPLFQVNAYQVNRGQRFYLRMEVPQIFGLLRGELLVRYQQHELRLKAGDFALFPVLPERVALSVEKPVEYLQIQAGQGPS